jgi:hypothetical protein
MRRFPIIRGLWLKRGERLGIDQLLSRHPVHHGPRTAAAVRGGRIKRKVQLAGDLLRTERRFVDGLACGFERPVHCIEDLLLFGKLAVDGFLPAKSSIRRRGWRPLAG